jgi:phosphopantetheinyl transferase
MCEGVHCLLVELSSGDREEQRFVGRSFALSLASSLTGLPAASLAWERPSALSKPHVVCSSSSSGGSSAPVAGINISHEGRLLAVAFAAAPSASGAAPCIGVDAQSRGRAAAALASPYSGGGAGEALLLGGAGGTATALPTPRALSATEGAGAECALLFSLRWTLMEAVLKAKGEGLAVEGAGAAVLASAVEEEEEGEKEDRGGGKGVASQGRPSPPSLCLWGARLPSSSSSWREGPAVETVAAAAVAKAAQPPSAAEDASCSGTHATAPVEAVPFRVLARFRGPGWRATTCAVDWPSSSSSHTLTVAQLSTPL